jgi:Lar family restriction alleviation protein
MTGLGITIEHAKWCPFCGNEDTLTYKTYGDTVMAVACDCGGEGPGAGSPAMAVALWNTRASRIA